MKLILFIMMVFISFPGFGQEDDEAIYEELTQERLKSAERANEINEVKEGIEEQVYDMSAELQKIGRDQLNAASLLDDKVQAILIKGLEESKLRKQSPEFIRAMIMGKVKGKPLEKLFIQFPKLLDICVDVMRDNHAMPGLIRLFSKKEEMKKYGIFWIVLFIVGLILRKKLIPDETPLFRRFFLRTCLSLCLSMITLIVFYQMFKSEVGPTVEIIQRHL